MCFDPFQFVKEIASVRAKRGLICILIENKVRIFFQQTKMGLAEMFPTHMVSERFVIQTKLSFSDQKKKERTNDKRPHHLNGEMQLNSNVLPPVCV